MCRCYGSMETHAQVHLDREPRRKSAPHKLGVSFSDMLFLWSQRFYVSMLFAGKSGILRELMRKPCFQNDNCEPRLLQIWIFEYWFELISTFPVQICCTRNRAFTWNCVHIDASKMSTAMEFCSGAANSSAAFGRSINAKYEFAASNSGSKLRTAPNASSRSSY